MNNSIKSFSTLDLIFRKVYFIPLDDDIAESELKRRKIPDFAAQILVACVLPFIALERLGAVFNFEDIDYDGVKAEIGSSLFVSFLLSTPIIAGTGFAVWWFTNEFGIKTIVISLLSWPISGVFFFLWQEKYTDQF